ncbi:conserved membrane protein of unknown function [Nitrospira sp. KM1]|uniref:hypothetical protein n=1 Tax=Nitrospira sp. KM1 TaxID=1936990 RepID=UPI0013A751F3|nr:hypothetical protein [Nitrospira sp. KM1]BCA55655.1 conserved membrane protein of unknown function [Nitrospira sp. KM1]
MILAGMFAALLFLGLILGDWLYFVRLTPDASRYGCGIAKSQSTIRAVSLPSFRKRLDDNGGALILPHGIARMYPDLDQIAIRPQYHLFSMSFRTAWPVKGLIHLSTGEESTNMLCVKRIPWSSALITMLWFLLVGAGTASFLVMYALQGGLDSFTGVLMGAGILGIGLLVFAFGLVTVVISYRLENSRLERVYGELRAEMEKTAAT